MLLVKDLLSFERAKIKRHLLELEVVIRLLNILDSI